MIFSFSERSTAPEILDNFELQGNDLSENLLELEKVNRYLGGYSSVLKGVEKIIKSRPFSKKITVADVGCGGGDTLKALARWGRKHDLELELIGIDANHSAIEYAKAATEAYGEISIVHGDLLTPDFMPAPADIVMFNMVLHHFTDEQIIHILSKCRASGSSILINDLQRSWVAYQLFRLASGALGFSHISRHDGKLSIRKSFLRRDWRSLLVKAGIKDFDISWQWAFRYLVLVK